MKQQGTVNIEDLHKLAEDLQKDIEERNILHKRELIAAEDKNKEEMKELIKTFF